MLDVSSLAFSGTTGNLDIGNNAMIVRATDQTDLGTKVALVQSKVNAAANLLAWDGHGITASAVLDDLQVNGELTIMGYESSLLYLNAFAGISGLGSFDEITGNPIDFNQGPLKVTCLGDGIVDGSDYGLLNYGFQTPVYGVLSGTESAVPQVTTAAPVAPEAVPEPGIWSLVVSGLGLLSSSRRLRRRNASNL